MRDLSYAEHVMHEARLELDAVPDDAPSWLRMRAEEWADAAEVRFLREVDAYVMEATR